jgi:hypothetical protein
MTNIYFLDSWGAIYQIVPNPNQEDAKTLLGFGPRMWSKETTLLGCRSLAELSAKGLEDRIRLWEEDGWTFIGEVSS